VYFLLGWGAGFVIYDVLTATGLHWLVWPVVAALAAFVLGGSLIRRRRARR
jgi:hypothetical protein